MKKNKNKRVLVLEDDKNILNNLVELLESEGYTVKSALNGQDGYNILKFYKPDLILCDIMMPHVNGYEFYKMVKDNYETKFTPFIFLTAKTDLSSIRTGLNLGVDDYVTKPFSAGDLVKTIETRLSKQSDFNQQFESLVRNINMYIPHELRTPLVAIIGFSQLILSDMETMEKKEIKEVTERILWAANRLHGRIEKFISYSELNLTEGSFIETKEQESSQIDNFFVSRVIGSHFYIYDRESAIDLSLEPADIAIPEVHLERLLKEILENAVKYSSFNSTIYVTGVVSGREYLISIKDCGIGMTEEEIEQIGVFQQFSREAHSQEGNGLGLAIAKRILQLNNGAIEIKSQKNSFTEVTIKLNVVSNGE